MYTTLTIFVSTQIDPKNIAFPCQLQQWSLLLSFQARSNKEQRKTLTQGLILHTSQCQYVAAGKNLYSSDQGEFDNADFVLKFYPYNNGKRQVSTDVTKRMIQYDCLKSSKQGDFENMILVWSRFYDSTQFLFEGVTWTKTFLTNLMKVEIWHR